MAAFAMQRALGLMSWATLREDTDNRRDGFRRFCAVIHMRGWLWTRSRAGTFEMCAQWTDGHDHGGAMLGPVLQGVRMSQCGAMSSYIISGGAG